MTAEEFTSEKATGQLEASLTLHLGNEGHPEVMISPVSYTHLTLPTILRV